MPKRPTASTRPRQVRVQRHTHHRPAAGVILPVQSAYEAVGTAITPSGLDDLR
jgi:hypothetical protein